MKTKKVKSAGRFGSGYGVRVREKLVALESKQKIKQTCPFCKGMAKRLSKGIWKCNKCRKKFASHTYYLGEKEKT